VYKREVWHEKPDDDTAARPHANHPGAEQQSERLVFSLEVSPRELYACDEELDAENETAEVECGGVDGLFGDDELVWLDELGHLYGEYAGEQGDD
jgi:hypothetical protein